MIFLNRIIQIRLSYDAFQIIGQHCTYRVDFRLETSREPVASIFMQISLHQKYIELEGLSVFG